MRIHRYAVVRDSATPGGSFDGPGFSTANPELMLIDVEYVEEFVAQSYSYPLNPVDQ